MTQAVTGTAQSLQQARTPAPWLIRVVAVLVALAGLAFLVGGIELMLVGGSPCYLLGGLVLCASAVLLWLRDDRGSLLYGLFLCVTLVWALYEAGLHVFALMPRLLAPGVLGIALLLPRFRREVGAGYRSPGSIATGLGLAGIVLAMTIASFQGSAAPGVLPERNDSLLAPAFGAPGEWRSYGATPGASRFGNLDQITPANVADLEPAWTYRSGIKAKGIPAPWEVTPLMVGGNLFMCAQENTIISVDGDTGKELWRFDPHVDRTGANALSACRGVAYYETDAASGKVGETDAALGSEPVCARRIIAPTVDARLIAVDAATGKPCPDFGTNGQIDLREGMGAVEPGYYYQSSPPAIAGGKVIIGGLVLDNQKVGVPSGVIRAFDAKTGKLAWAWDLGRPGYYGAPGPGEEYTRDTPNSWAPMSVDEKLGLVYVPTGNATPDHWGGHRSAQSEIYASSLVALDLATGAPRWHRQFTHHDVWDYDVASQPTLIDIPQPGGAVVPAVVQVTKNGQIYVLDRRTGSAVHKIVEKPVPGPTVPDARHSPTQPYSVGMPHFGGDLIHESDMWGVTPFDQLACRIKFHKLHYEGMYTPPSEEGALMFPGVAGGMNWGSISTDPTRGVMVVNANFLPHIITLVPRAKAEGVKLDTAAKASSEFVDKSLAIGTPYEMHRSWFSGPLDVPCLQPPFGLISAIDLHSGKTIWSRNLGTGHDTGPLGFASNLSLPTGTPNQGGSIVTRSGLVFIGATQERAFRAFDLKTGKELWQTRLPASAQATPMTYTSPRTGRQYVVVAAGGYPPFDPTRLGDYIMAYALPDRGRRN